MKTVTLSRLPTFQGDVMITICDAIPTGAVRDDRDDRAIVAHSETGHHHVAMGPLEFYRNPAEPLVTYARAGGAFTVSQVDAAAVLALEREEMIDLLLTSHWDQRDRSAAHLQRLPLGSHVHLFAKSARGEGFFLVWNGPGQPSVLNRAAFRAIATEAGAEGLTQPFHVYARTSTYSGPNVEFYQIPNLRDWDTHEPIAFDAPEGALVRFDRQEEWTPEGWQDVTD